MVHGLRTSGVSLLDKVSPVSARLSRPMEHRSPATTWSQGRWVLPSGIDKAPIRSSSSWSSWPTEELSSSGLPKKDAKCPDTCTVASGRTVPEKTRTRLTRPTYGSEVVLTTSATSGPSGSQVSAGPALPSGVKTSGMGCSSGEGKPATTRSSSSVTPAADVASTGSTGWKDPRATARSRSASRRARSTSSPPRKRSIRVSSSDSSMTASIRAARWASWAPWSSGSSESRPTSRSPSRRYTGTTLSPKACCAWATTPS